MSDTQKEKIAFCYGVMGGEYPPKLVSIHMEFEDAKASVDQRIESAKRFAEQVPILNSVEYFVIEMPIVYVDQWKRK